MSFNSFLRKILLFSLAGAIMLTFVGCNFTPGENTGKNAPEPTATPEPTPLPDLPEQDEINDPGDRITYKLAGMFGDNMVVQRDQYVKVWGFADQTSGYMYGEFMGEKRYAEIGSDGKFTLMFSAHEASCEPTQMKIYPKNGDETVIENVVIGDVYLISGQSNAELNMTTAINTMSNDQKNKLKEKINADDNIRVIIQYRELVLAKKSYYQTPQKDVVKSGIKWLQGNVRSAWGKTSAIGYYFAMALRELQPEVPVGIIMMAAGGSPLSELMSANALTEAGLPDNIGIIYNAMINPFIGLPCSGMIFYQGESNTSGGGYKLYAEHLKIFVNDLRSLWGFDFPFYNVQLSSHLTDASKELWPELPEIRDAQFKAYDLISNYYLIVSMDKGHKAEDGQDWAHPKDKEPIGRRIALATLSTIYGKMDPETYLSPEPSKVEFKGTEAIITFKHVGTGLKLYAETGEKLVGFSYKVDGKQYDAEAEIISENQVKITIDKNATSVGYCMQQDGYPQYANLVNSEGLPCPAFSWDK